VNESPHMEKPVRKRSKPGARYGVRRNVEWEWRNVDLVSGERSNVDLEMGVSWKCDFGNGELGNVILEMEN